MAYPTDKELKKSLKPYVVGLWLGSIFLLSLGAWLSWNEMVPTAFARAGALSVLLGLAVFFYLEKREFFTGMHAGAWDASNHVVPKGVIGPHVTWTTILGSCTAILGDLVISLVKCGAMKC
ncbi:hypothetical protein [Roseovarius sp. D22-M7]|uniref:hypothetical protein n=1 Tax=Roseovarius sp. D22-M7 TaxID=3127116 RepID=UPI00300FFE19